MSASARELDDALLAIVADWSRGGVGCDEALFEERALATYAYQMERTRRTRLRSVPSVRLPQSDSAIKFPYPTRRSVSSKVFSVARAASERP